MFTIESFDSGLRVDVRNTYSDDMTSILTHRICEIPVANTKG